MNKQIIENLKQQAENGNFANINVFDFTGDVDNFILECEENNLEFTSRNTDILYFKESL